MTARFETRLDDYQRLKAGPACVELGFDLVLISGEDRVKFLHNFCTADIRGALPGQGRELFVLNVKGKVINYGYVLVDDESLWLLVAADSADELIRHLDRYVIADDVVLADQTGSYCFLFLTGEFLEAVPELAGVAAKASEAAPVAADGYLDHWPAQITEAACRIVRTQWIGGTERLLLVPSDSRESLLEWLVAKGFTTVDRQIFEVARIAAGTPRYGTDITLDNLPQEVRRDQFAISFTKGCYLGQETVARIDALGHVNKFLVILEFASDPSDRGDEFNEGQGTSEKTLNAHLPDPGTELFSGGKRVGQVASVAYSPVAKAPIALGYVRRGLETPGTELESPSGIARVVA